MVQLLRHRRGNESYAHRIAHQAHDIVHFQPLHDLAAVAFNRLHAESKPPRDFARTMPFSDECEDFDLTSGELVQRASNSERLVDGGSQATEVRLENEILRSGPYCRDALSAAYGSGHDDERSSWPQIPKYLLRRARVELTARVVRQDDIRRKIPDSRGERCLGIDPFGEGDEAGSIQLVPNQFGIRFGILVHQNAYRFCTSHYGYISKWLTIRGRKFIALRHYLRFSLKVRSSPKPAIIVPCCTLLCTHCDQSITSSSIA